MEPRRRWYTEPETFIAVAALIVSVTAVVVGVYEASLQRHHDLAEVWPHAEIQVFTKGTGAEIRLENTGIGPAIIQSVIVSVDGKPAQDWPGVLRTLNGAEPSGVSNATAAQHGLRPGEHISLLDVSAASTPRDFWKTIARVRMTVCYASVFNEYWIVESKALGTSPSWRSVKECPPQPIGMDF